jgi:hypothetical protein
LRRIEMNMSIEELDAMFEKRASDDPQVGELVRESVGVVVDDEEE